MKQSHTPGKMFGYMHTYCSDAYFHLHTPECVNRKQKVVFFCKISEEQPFWFLLSGNHAVLYVLDNSESFFYMGVQFLHNICTILFTVKHN